MPKPPPAPKAHAKPKKPAIAPAKPTANRKPRTENLPPPTPDVTAAAHIPKNHIKGAKERHAAFARELFAHGNVLKAYRAVFSPPKTSSPKSVEASAYRLKRHPNVVNELRRLERLHAEQLAQQAKEAEKARAQAEKDAIASRTEVLKFHTAVMRAPSSDLSNKDLVLVVETMRLAPTKHDKEGNEIPHPDADDQGYITDVTRRPPDLKERLSAANAIAAMQGWNKGDPALNKVGDQLTNLLLEIRGGGKA